jgi:hypothetical protein
MNALKPLLEKDLLKMVTVKYYINQLVVPLKLADKNAWIVEQNCLHVTESMHYGAFGVAVCVCEVSENPWDWLTLFDKFFFRFSSHNFNTAKL